MFEKIRQGINLAGDTLKEQAVSIGEAAREKTAKVIDSWISTLPKLEAYGFKTTYFAVSLSLNPTLEIELQSTCAAFPLGRVEAILAENAGNSPINMVFTTLKTTLSFHQKARIEAIDPLTVKIKVRLSPEVRVSLGNPILE